MLKGMALMAVGVLLLTINDAVSKHLVLSHPVGQVICLRQAATLLVIFPYVMLVTGWGALRVVNWPGQLMRGALFIAGSACIVLSLGLLPLAMVITIMFTSPIFVAAFSAPLLGERVGLHRWVAVFGGFAGVLIVVQPGTTAFQWALLLPVAAAFINAFRDVLTRLLSRTETSIAILFWSNHHPDGRRVGHRPLGLGAGERDGGAVVCRGRCQQRRRPFFCHRGAARGRQCVIRH